MDVSLNGRLIRFMRNDITKQDTEAIVNAANPSLLGGGGVDGAIHRAGGPSILEECKAIREKIKRCNPGEAVITNAGGMKSRYVIHTVGPVWNGGGNNEEELLKNCYINSLKLAQEHKIQSISFPSISTGAYGYPVEKASYIAIGTTLEYLTHTDIREVRFVLFSNMDLEQYLKAFKTISGENAPGEK